MNAKGLTIFEVVLAILIVGISVTTLLSLQGALSRVVFLSHAFVDRIGFIKSFFVEADRDRIFQKEKELKKVIDFPPLTMNYSIKKPTAKALKNASMLEVERVEASYRTILGPKSQTYARLRFVPRVEKKSEARI